MSPFAVLIPAYSRLSPRICITAVWVCAVLISTFLFNRYESTAGAVGATSSAWPEISSLLRSQEGVTVVVFLHPKCPCSTATVRQLFEVADELKPARLFTILVLPDGTEDGFAQGPVLDLLERRYKHCPLLDRGGREAELFGAKTSGQAYVYSKEGRLLFCGGLTPARGQIGYSPSLSKLKNSLRDPSSEAACCPVFGCPLQNLTQNAGY